MTAVTTPCCTACGRAISACGCCEGTKTRTPRPIDNRPGLPALRYRIGEHGDFLASMEAAIARETGPTTATDQTAARPLGKLTRRDTGDFSLALMDATATVADVLTFYQERLANEGYLRTARERRSVEELARLAGYEPRPGVSASVYLVYTVDDNTPDPVPIPKGAKSQTIPGPDELPQTFETADDLEARAAWNALRPRTLRMPQFRDLVHRVDGTRKVVRPGVVLPLKGLSTGLKPGHPLLLQNLREDGAEEHVLARVTAVDTDPPNDRTLVTLAPWLSIEQTAAFARAMALRGFAFEFVPDAEARLRAIMERRPRGDTTLKVQTALATLADLLADPDAASENRSSAWQEARRTAERARGQLPDGRVGERWVSGALEVLLAMVAGPNSNDAAARAAVAPPGNGDPASFDDAVLKLVQPPSKPRAHPSALPQSLEGQFSTNGDVGLQIMAAGNSDLAPIAAQALASYAGASAAPGLRVYAFRVHTGLFGRAAREQAVSLRDTSDQTHEVIYTRNFAWAVSVGDEPPATELTKRLDLDGVKDGIVPGSFVVLDFSAVSLASQGRLHKPNPNGADALLITNVDRVHAKVGRDKYGISAETTAVDLEHAWIAPGGGSGEGDGEDGDDVTDDGPPDDTNDPTNRGNFEIIRGTSVYAASDELELSPMSIAADSDPGFGAETYLELDGLYDGLPPGRLIMVSGERSDVPGVQGVRAAELAMVAEVLHDVRPRPGFGAGPASKAPAKGCRQPGALDGERNHTFLRLDQALSYRYKHETVAVYANVVRATHGETRDEVLGSGDGGASSQSFLLKHAPLTFVAAATPSGVTPALQVFVNGVRYERVSDFVDAGPTDRVYALRVDENGAARVQFGDGKAGARPPTGTGNIQATYRFGIGRGGNARAGQVHTLTTRPLGVKEVDNPLRASGGADRDARDATRRRAPTAVLTFGRLVSTPDYADFARTFAGVAKADAAELSNGRERVVHVTIAGEDDAPIDVDSDLYRRLFEALVAQGDPLQPIELATRDLSWLLIDLRVRIDPAYRWADVEAAVRARLVERFRFEARDLAQSVYSSEVASAAQSVPGVVYSDLERMAAIPSVMVDEDVGRPRPMTPAEIARAVVDAAPSTDPIHADRAKPAGNGIAPAQLVVLSPAFPATLALNEIK